MPVILSLFITRDLYSKTFTLCGAHLIKLIVTWFVPDRAIKRKFQKKIER